MTYVWIFLAGAFWDAVITIDTLATIRGSWITVFISTFVLTVLSCSVYNEVFVIEGWQIGRVCALALGSSLGAASIVLINNIRKEIRDGAV